MLGYSPLPLPSSRYRVAIVTGRKQFLFFWGPVRLQKSLCVSVECGRSAERVDSKTIVAQLWVGRERRTNEQTFGADNVGRNATKNSLNKRD